MGINFSGQDKMPFAIVAAGKKPAQKRATAEKQDGPGKHRPTAAGCNVIRQAVLDCCRSILTAYVESVEKVPRTYFEELLIKQGDKKRRI
jgi:hypothetical protein